MATHHVRRRHTALAGGLAILALCLGFTVSPASAAPPTPVDYVALGDSYTAGTGAGDLAGPFPAVPCWQSAGGYVDIVDASTRVTLIDNAACHGAFLGPVGTSTPVAQQIAELSGTALNSETDLVSITAGALDAGSGLALQACSTPDTQTCAVIVAGIIQNLGTVEAALEATYQSIQLAAPNATLVVLGYPRLFDPAKGDIVVGGVTVVPVANQILVNQAVDALNATIAKAVAESGTSAVFVDVTKRFTGHAVNSDNPWIVLDLTQPLLDANFHPNDAGHQAYASVMLSSVQLNKLVKR
ncbi:SGNH/GDSL hydrolase family protein [Paenarthrobacter sp. OM7]|uniref:SGNH/GDSL hydrolase family protein n=1 Tax=Paenarthrobacter sp. OM7 TaxID=3041264 RepID=UPI00246851A2|nr:SGNH/GDSL hydrolase family protein [Paenarthrobacter sp. OM7]WGM19575.1 SGNH/GDSL hydrolase family protein [Paenarthrobacter sp. OM7]